MSARWDAYRAAIRAAVDAEQAIAARSVIGRDDGSDTQLVKQQLKRLGGFHLPNLQGRAALHIRALRRRLRAARKVPVHGFNVGHQHQPQTFDHRARPVRIVFACTAHGPSSPASTAADANSAAGSPHRLSGDQN